MTGMDRVPPPDGGFGWCIVLGASLVHLLFGILLRGIGVYYIEFRRRFDTSATVTAWLIALSMGLFNGLGPLVTSACTKFGCRQVVYLGAVLYSLGFILTGLAPSIIVAYVTFGVVLGSALCLIYTPGYILVSDYFDKRKASALALSTLGSAVGAFVGPPLVDFLFGFYGFFGGFLILGGLGLHAAISATLYRPLNQHYRIQNAQRLRRSRTLEVQFATLDQTKSIPEKVTLIDPENCPADIPEDVKNRSPESQVSGEASSQESRVSAPDSVENHATTSQSVKDNSTGPEGRPAPAKRKIFNFSLMKDMNFLLLSITYMMTSMCLGATITFLPAMALDRGVSRWSAIFLLSVLGISDGLTRIPLGLLFDVKAIRPHRTNVYLGTMSATGLVMLLFPVFSNYWVLVTLCVLRGALTSLIMPQRMTIMGDMFGVARAPSGLGIQMFMMAIGSVISRLMGGLFKDYVGMYDPVFYISGALLVISSSVLLVVLALQKKKARCDLPTD